jgi:hypothetical protein
MNIQAPEPKETKITDHGTNVCPNFSEMGYRRYRDEVDRFGSQLKAESEHIADGLHADTVSSKHVAQAAEALRNRHRQKRLEVLGNAGSLIAGAGMSAAIGLFGSGQASSWLMPVTVIMTVSGASVMARYSGR